MLRAANLIFSYNYKDGQNKFSLQDINLNISDGDFVGIFGPNGCGKSTLLKLLSGVLNPKSGQVLLHNKNMRAINRKEIAKKIARALAQKPEILLLDEPNSHLDLKHQVLIYDLLQKLNVEQRISIVTVSHDLNLSANYCKRAVLMNEGLVYCYGSISDVLTEEHIKNIFDLDSRVNFNYSEDDISIVIKPKKQTN
jgi:ABC-type cobalamin/Fe3+-siderophores transport system ATPase subunit